jgi:hypothetical protein
LVKSGNNSNGRIGLGSHLVMTNSWPWKDPPFYPAVN